MLEVSRRRRALLSAALLISASIIGAFIVLFSGKRQIVSIDVDCSAVLGKMVDLLGVNDGPLGPKGWDSSAYPYDFTEHYEKMGVKFIRVHDLWGSADIDAVFPDFSKSPNDEEAYDFSSTDRHIRVMLQTGALVIFRLGYSWSDPPRNSPPADYDKWADVCLHIVKHCNEGWANGMNRTIRYWEIWNEPDIEQFWSGTVEDYFLLYDKTARRIKEHDPSNLVGGPALAYDLNFLREFLRMCNESGTPLDFVSWHAYSKDPRDVYLRAIAVRSLMDEYGFSGRLSALTEWNIWKENSDPYEIFRNQVGASFCASCLIYLQNASVDIANFYRGDSWPWGGIFYDDGSAGKTYYVMVAMKGATEKTVRLKCTTEGGGRGLAVMATRSEEGSSVTVIISNHGRDRYSYRVNVSRIPWVEQGFSYEVRSIDERANLDVLRTGTGSDDYLETSLDIEPHAVHILQIREKLPSTP